MGTITPNSTIYLLKGVPLDNTYADTMYFQPEIIGGVQKTLQEAQLYHFLNDIPDRITIAAHDYQRVSEGVLRINKPISDVYNVNYMIFQNSGVIGGAAASFYPSKYFYAFVTNVEYVNEQASNVYFEIDVIQTWLGEYETEPCFIERETTMGDGIGDHILAEPVSCSAYTESIENPLGDNFVNYSVVVTNTIGLEGEIQPA